MVSPGMWCVGYTVMNSELSVRTTVGHDIVDRDFELLLPSGTGTHQHG
jgi:hypothetical protein